MSPRIIKELRILAPYGLTGLAAMIIPDYLRRRFGWEAWDTLRIMGLMHYTLASLMSALLFGAEYGDRTMERLLAQPIPRIRTWREKTVILGALIAFYVLLDHLYFFYLSAVTHTGIIHHYDEFAILICGLAISFCTGPWISFYARQTHTAFWATMIFPIACFLLLAIAREWIGGAGAVPADSLWAFAAVWCPMAYWLGRRKFLNLEV